MSTSIKIKIARTDRGVTYYHVLSSVRRVVATQIAYICRFINKSQIISQLYKKKLIEKQIYLYIYSCISLHIYYILRGGMRLIKMSLASAQIMLQPDTEKRVFPHAIPNHIPHFISFLKLKFRFKIPKF